MRLPKTNDRITCIQCMPFPSCRSLKMFVCDFRNHCFLFYEPDLLSAWWLTQQNNITINFFPYLNTITLANNLLNCYIQNKCGYNVGSPSVSFTINYSLMCNQFKELSIFDAVDHTDCRWTLNILPIGKKQMAVLQWILRWPFFIMKTSILNL